MSEIEITSKTPFISSSPNVSADGLGDFSYSSTRKKQKSDLPKGADEVENTDSTTTPVTSNKLPKSIFNSYYLFRNKKVTGENYPLTDEDLANDTDLTKPLTAINLVDNPRGASIYRPEDFLYCSKFDIIPLERMVTARRFSFPVYDDIFSTDKDINPVPDISRLIGFSDQETNKFSDIMSFSFGMRWKELKSSMEQMNMQGDQNGVSGYMRHVMQFADPKFGNEALRGENELNYNPMNDSNKVYGPVDSIDSTYIRDVGLNFNQDIKLTFEYSMKSIGGINGKTAFIDLLSNMLVFGTNDAKFWSGARFWLGVKPTKYMDMLKKNEPSNFSDVVSSAHKSFSGMMSGMSEGGDGNVFSTLIDNVKNLALGKLMNTVGRASIPYMNSLLTGNPVGLWHITIGNPFNPAMTIGNLLLDNMDIRFSDNFSIDGFPDKIWCDCSFKHAMPRGRAEIESMFNNGKGRTYLKPKEVFTDKYTSTSTKTTPTSLHDKTKIDFDTYFGDFTRDDILKNTEGVWSFLK